MRGQFNVVYILVFASRKGGTPVPAAPRGEPLGKLKVSWHLLNHIPRQMAMTNPKCSWAETNPRGQRCRGTGTAFKKGLTWSLQGQNKASLDERQQPCLLQLGSERSGALRLATRITLESL